MKYINKICMFLLIAMLIGVIGCESNKDDGDIGKDAKYSQASEIELSGQIRINIMDENLNPIENAKICFIDTKGKLIAKIESNKDGKYYNAFKVHQDDVFSSNIDNGLDRRGTVTMIVKKETYIPVVLFEVPVGGASSTQNVIMKKAIEGERNEPEYRVAENHHLEISAMVEKYTKQDVESK